MKTKETEFLTEVEKVYKLMYKHFEHKFSGVVPHNKIKPTITNLFRGRLSNSDEYKDECNRSGRGIEGRNTFNHLCWWFGQPVTIDYELFKLLEKPNFFFRFSRPFVLIEPATTNKELEKRRVRINIILRHEHRPNCEGTLLEFYKKHLFENR